MFEPEKKIPNTARTTETTQAAVEAELHGRDKFSGRPQTQRRHCSRSSAWDLSSLTVNDRRRYSCVSVVFDINVLASSRDIPKPHSIATVRAASEHHSLDVVDVVDEVISDFEEKTEVSFSKEYLKPKILDKIKGKESEIQRSELKQEISQLMPFMMLSSLGEELSEEEREDLSESIKKIELEGEEL